MSREYQRPPQVEITTPFGGMELVCWGDSATLGIKSGGVITINKVKYAGAWLSLEVYDGKWVMRRYRDHRGGVFDRPDYRSRSLSRLDFKDASEAARKRFDETAEALAAEYLSEHPLMVQNGHLARLSEAVRVAESEYERKLAETALAMKVLDATLEAEREFHGSEGLPM